MGMAASQARFLGLTARKSNIEYQGQQVNQQRTALANESANLYNQMMTLDVPTPPATTDFYKTTYELENSETTGIEGNYTIENLVKLYDGTNRYKVILGYKTTELEKTSYSQFIQGNNLDTEKKMYTFNMSNTEDGTTYDLTLKYNTEGETTTYGSDPFTGPEVEDESGTKQKSLSVTDNVIYKVNSSRMSEIDGAKECCTDISDENPYYFYRIDGKTYFLNRTNIENMVNFNSSETGAKTIDYYRAITKTNNLTTDVEGTLEKSSTGRFSSLAIDNNTKYPANLKNTKFTLNVKQVFNQEGYDNAMNDYKFEKDVYEKAISDINAKTEIVQKQDQNLELRLDQLDTEQNAVNTEMEAVKKVLKDNVDKTFKTFNA